MGRRVECLPHCVHAAHSAQRAAELAAGPALQRVLRSGGLRVTVFARLVGVVAEVVASSG